MYPANNEMLQKPLAQTIPATGGLDFVSPKVGVQPSTLQECMNYEVSREAGYSLIEGLLRFSGRSTYVVNSWVEASYTPLDNNILAVSGEEDGATGAIALYDYTNGSLTLSSRLSLGGGQFDASAIRFNSKGSKVYFVYTNTSSLDTFLGSADVDLNNTLSNFQSIVSLSGSATTATNALAISEDETRAAVGLQVSPYLFWVDISGGSILDSITPSIGTAITDLVLNDDEDKIIITEGSSGTTQYVALYSIASDALTEESTLDLGTNGASSIYRLDATKAWVSGSAETNAIDYSTTTVSSLDSVANGDTSIVGDASRAFVESREYSWDGSSITDEGAINLDINRELSINSDTTYLAGTAPTSTSGILELWDISDLSIEADTVTGAVGGRTRSSAFMPARGQLYEGGVYTATNTGGTESGRVKILELNEGAGTLKYQIIE